LTGCPDSSSGSHEKSDVPATTTTKPPSTTAGAPGVTTQAAGTPTTAAPVTTQPNSGGNGNQTAGDQTPGVQTVDCTARPAMTLALFADETLARDQKTVEGLLELRTPAGFAVKVSGAYRNSAGANASHFELTQSWQGIPLCGYRAKAHVIGSEATVPYFQSYGTPASVSDAAFGLPEHVAAAAAIAAGEIRVRSAERCWQPVDGELVAAQDVMASIGGVPYRIVGNEQEAFLVEAQSLHVAQATAKVYKRSPLDTGLTEMPIEVADNGTLDGGKLRVVDTGGKVLATKAVAGKLAPAIDTAAFQEASLFAHAQEQINFALKYRTVSAADCMPIEIEAHAGPNDGPVYLPSWNQDTGHPRIVVPDEIPATLKNLSTDYDAVAHETSHHFVYQRLKSLSFEPSKVIHEGLADFFVFAHNNDTCLGKSICPTESVSDLCVLHAQCLRTGDVTKSNMKFHSATYDAAPYHKKGQAVSGLLVAIGKDKTVGSDVIAKIMFAGIDFLKEKSDLGDWLEAVLQGDKAAYGGAHACVILAKAKEFGLADESAGLDCQSYQK
jgi:hypothetical protein